MDCNLKKSNRNSKDGVFADSIAAAALNSIPKQCQGTSWSFCLKNFFEMLQKGKLIHTTFLKAQQNKLV